MSEYRSFISPRMLAALFVATAISLISILAVFSGAPYDDEITNIRIVSGHDLLSIIRIMNSEDVHSPGSYVINKILYGLLHSWTAVKISGGILNGLGLATFVWLGYDKFDPRQRRWVALLLASAATVVLWGASVRWYAYFNPIFTATLAVVLFADISRSARSVVIGIAAVVLFHLSYATFCALPVLLVAHVGREFGRLQGRDLRFLFFVGCVAFLACLPQFLVFVHVHAHNQASQTGSALQALLQSGMTLVLGNAVFPFAVLPCIYAVVVTLSVSFFLFARRGSRLDWVALASLATGLLCITLTGLGIKPRNSVFLLPLAAMLLGAALARLPRWPQALAALVVLMYQALGIWNVVAHENTTKGSYNTDFRGIVDDIQKWRTGCGATVVLNHDPVLSYLLEQAQIAQSSPYASVTRPMVELASGDCVIAVETYRGVLPASTLEPLYAIVASDSLKIQQSRDIGADRYHAAKAWIAHEPFPPFYAHLELFKVQRGISLPLLSAP